MTALLIAVITLLAIGTIVAETRNLRPQLYVLKPATTCSIIALAWPFATESPSEYQYLIALGLVLSLAGDVFLMLPQDRFLAGLVSFLFAHLAYIGAFRVGAPTTEPWAITVFVAYGIGLYAWLFPHFGRHRWAAAAYTVVIAAMAAQAVSRASSLGDHHSTLAVVGAMLFLISDSLLAVDRFRGTFAGARACVLGTYFAAQALIALSARNG